MVSDQSWFDTKYYMQNLKPIIHQHVNPLLADFKTLHAGKAPETYSGFIYMWKCIPEDCYYIGSHQGTYYDEYRGSGRRFRQVFEHYGMTQFERIILEYVIEKSDILSREQYWINQFKAVKSAQFYNQKNAVKYLAN